MNVSAKSFFPLLLMLFLLLLQETSHAQTYTMTSGTVNTCSGTFYDPGGASNYGNNLNVTQTFCATGSNCISFTFTSFRTQGGNDFLYIYDGPTIASPLIGTFSGSTSPGTVTSTSGCLTFRFVSNGSTNRQGWSANISCTPCGSTFLLNNNTAVNTCSGLFYDSGGSSGNYGQSDNYTKTFCSNAGTCLKMVFTSFALRSGDIMTIYDGPNASSPQIGTYQNGPSPGTILSSTGCITVRFVSNGNASVNSGWAATISCEVCPSPPGSVNYTHPTIGLQNSNVGTNMVATCGGTYTDNGGVASNYSNNINYVYRTFCPDQAGNCLRATFWQFSTESGFDYLSVLNGPTQNSPEFGAGSSWSGTASSYQATMAAGMGPYTSTDQSGCITFRFNSDNTLNLPGWVTTFDCVPCANGPTGTDNSDCADFTPICTDQSFTDASTGPGIVSDGGGGCVLAENYSNWYKILIQNSGTLGLRIVPNVASDDYDFALYQATSCGAITTPTRCSFAANTGNTGMDNALNLSTNTAVCGTPNNGSDLSEDVCGNAWTDTKPVLAGETYYLMVNKWSPGGSGFTLDWMLTGGSSLNCLLLPIELLSFTAEPNGEVVDLKWSTATEINNDYFILERSSDSYEFQPIQIVDAAGNSSHTLNYKTVDASPLSGISYYRLKQTDYDGRSSNSQVVSVDFRKQKDEFTIYPNPATDDVILVYHCQKSSATRIRVLDLKGQLVYSINTESAKGMNKLNLDLPELDAGVFVVFLETDLKEMKKRLVIN
ncbi:MAG: T9SS type A sorting domain-containing protein [Bacteroidetes bacterium]|nr:MAG: T9SS type A sorting domain-containing protein [Bacteroidota bacterium]